MEDGKLRVGARFNLQSLSWKDYTHIFSVTEKAFAQIYIHNDANVEI